MSAPAGAGAGDFGALREAELDAAAELLARAFRDNPLNCAVIGDDPGRRLRSNRLAMRATLPVAFGHGQLRAMRQAGRLAGVLLATEPGRFPLPAPSPGARFRCTLGQGLRVAARWGEVWDRLADCHPPYRHWHLATLGVDAERQGRGIGAALLEAWLAELRESPHGIWLETDREENLRFYARHGFEEVRRLQLMGVPVWLLWRPRKARGEAVASGDAG